MDQLPLKTCLQGWKTRKRLGQLKKTLPQLQESFRRKRQGRIDGEELQRVSDRVKSDRFLEAKRAMRASKQRQLDALELVPPGVYHFINALKGEFQAPVFYDPMCNVICQTDKIAKKCLIFNCSGDTKKEVFMSRREFRSIFLENPVWQLRTFSRSVTIPEKQPSLWPLETVRILPIVSADEYFFSKPNKIWLKRWF